METEQLQPTLSSLFNKGKLFIKAIIIFFMALALWIPSHFIMELVKERSYRQKEAIADISNKWAGKQTITGPMLMIPYIENTTDAKGIVSTAKKTALFMADKMEGQAKVFPEKRKRGIYEVAVYRTQIDIKGKFNSLKWQELKVPADKIIWNEAQVFFHVTDNLKGLNEDVFIKWNDTAFLLNPLASIYPLKDGFSASVPVSAEAAGSELSFSMHFDLNGSSQLLFANAARENRIEMESSWSNPSFTGVKLPDERTVSDSGFTAKWKYMNRAMPPVWKDSWYDLSQVCSGADLLITVDSYDKTERSVKYALLCIVLTFAAFFLIETVYNKPLHLVQYGLAGLALVLFYTLLLSISEYTGFNTAYIISGAATIGLVAWYIGSVMKSMQLALFISFVLTVVYGYIFIIIQLQDYALLMGSIGLFITLAIIMYFSKKIKW